MRSLHEAVLKLTRRQPAMKSRRRLATLLLTAAALAMMVVAATFAASTEGQAHPNAYSSTLDWDVSMSAPLRSCPGPTPTGNDGDVNIEEGECPDVTTSFWIQRAGGAGGTQSLFDRANVIWMTGPLGGDVTGDTVQDAQHGLVPNRPDTWGAKVGTVSLQMQSNLFVGTLPQNNIDDVGGGNDNKVTGQPVRCGADLDNDGFVDTLPLQDAFELWNAVPDERNDTIGYEFTQLPDPEYPPGCGSSPGHACAPMAVRKLPEAILSLETAMGLPATSRVSRAYGIARLPIVGGVTSNIDVNFLVYSLHGVPGNGVNGYLSMTLIQYPGLPAPDPTFSIYNPLSQSVQTCPPYSTSVTIYGVTAGSDFNEDGVSDWSVTPELDRLVVCAGPGCGTYDYSIETSMASDYDGDTIPVYADRCDTDPASGSAAGDTDGDTLTGTCDSNGEGNNPKDPEPTPKWNAAPSWDSGQDVDRDGHLNYIDNCPATRDRDLDNDTYIDYQRDADGDTVGDVCDPAPLVPGDGSGYPNPSPGMFVDYDDICRDPWTINQPETTSDEGRQCLKQSGAVTGWEDSDDDGVPDYVNLAPVAGPVIADCDSDSDKDGMVDGVEAAPGSVQPCGPSLGPGLGTDPLDASSPAAGPVGGIVEPPFLEHYRAAEGSSGTDLRMLILVASVAVGSLLLIRSAWRRRRRWRV